MCSNMIMGWEASFNHASDSASSSMIQLARAPLVPPQPPEPLEKDLCSFQTSVEEVSAVPAQGSLMLVEAASVASSTDAVFHQSLSSYLSSASLGAVIHCNSLLFAA